MRSHYSEEQIIAALQSVGIKKGDTIFSHVSLLPLGFLHGAVTPKDIVLTFKQALESIIGPYGCFITPSFSYSFCKGEIFDLSSTTSECGPFSNILIRMSGVKRSADPLFSVLGFGNIASLFERLPNCSFGEDCLYERLLARNAKIVNIGLSLSYLTGIHYLERTMNVLYRYDKVFSGTMMINENRVKTDWVYYVRCLDMPSYPDCSELQRVGLAQGIVKRERLGLGFVSSVQMIEYYRLAKYCISQDPWFLTINGRWRKSSRLQ